jgi:hypothetical protein
MPRLIPSLGTKCLPATFHLVQGCPTRAARSGSATFVRIEQSLLTAVLHDGNSHLRPPETREALVMKLYRVLRLLVVSAWLLQALAYFLPFTSWYADHIFHGLMAYDGADARITFQSSLPYAVPLWGFLVAAIGLFFLQNWGRYLHLALWVYGWIGIFAFGTRVTHPIHGFLEATLWTMDGMILALAFLSPLKDRFSHAASQGSEATGDAITDGERS